MDGPVTVTESASRPDGGRLGEVLEKLAGRLARYATPAGSFSRCREAVALVTEALSREGFEAVPVRLAEGHGGYPRAHRRWKELGSPHWWVHYVVLVDGMAVDFTGRQFDPGCPFPSVRPIAEVAEEWGQCDRIVSPADNTPVESLKAPLPRP